MLVNPDYLMHQEIFKLWKIIHNLRDSLKDANATIKKLEKKLKEKNQ